MSVEMVREVRGRLFAETLPFGYVDLHHASVMHDKLDGSEPQTSQRVSNYTQGFGQDPGSICRLLFIGGHVSNLSKRGAVPPHCPILNQIC